MWTPHKAKFENIKNLIYEVAMKAMQRIVERLEYIFYATLKFLVT